MTKKISNNLVSIETSVFVSNVFALSCMVLRDENKVEGKRFTLNDYDNKSAFIEAATKFASDELHDTTTDLIFQDAESELCISVFTDYQGNISEELWKMFALSDDDLSLLNDYLSYHALLNYDALGNSVEESLAEAKRCYIGYFPTHKDFVEDVETHTRRNSYNHRCRYFRQSK